MSLYLHLETSPGRSGDDPPQGRKQDDIHTCPSSLWAPPPGEENSFCSREPVGCGMCWGRSEEAVISHSVPSSVPRALVLGWWEGRDMGVERRGLFGRLLVPGIPRQASWGPGVQQSLPAAWKFPSRIVVNMSVWGIFMGLCHYKDLFHHQTPLCIPGLKQSLKALAPNSCF